jgi:plastocyanin
MVHARLSAVTVLVTAGLLLASCGGGGGGGGSGYSTAPPSGNGNNQTPTPTTSVSVKNNVFTPQDISVSGGSTVTWTWDSCSPDPYGGAQTCVDHSVLFDDGTTSPTKSSGAYTRTFSAPGTYPYHCAVHGAAMSGKVVVQ